MTNLDAIFRPRSVAVIGASNTPGKVGYILTRNMIESGYSGTIWPINLRSNLIQGLKAYKTITEIPVDVDLAVIAIPSSLVLQVAEECGEKGVKALIVISAGFKETGHEGALLEEQLIDIGRKYSMRIQGPNCLGLINTETNLNLSFAPAMPKLGKIGFISQSGALGTAVLDWVIQEDIGFHSFISLGNKGDLDEVDFIEAMAEDDDIKVILLYLESIEKGRRFLEVASNVVRRKPIVVLKGGTSSAGAKAAGSHTGALVGSFMAYKTAFDKSGVILAESVEDLFNYALAFAEQPLPKDEGIVIVTNAGGPGILATDLSEKLGIKLTALSMDLRERIVNGLPPAAATGNPIDVLGDAMADRYAFAIREVLTDYQIHAVLVILTPQAMTQSLETAKAMVEIQKEIKSKPIIGVFMGGGRVHSAIELLRDNGIPCYDFPEKGVKTLDALYRYAKFLKEPQHEQTKFDDVNSETVRNIIKTARKEGRVVLLADETVQIAEAYGMRTAGDRIARSDEEAVKIAGELGYPVVMKIASPDILHKTDVGGISLNLKKDAEVRLAYDHILTNVERLMPQALIRGVSISKMVPPGREMIIGMSQDVQFGPLVMFGLGGIYVNFLKDVSFRLTPLSDYEVEHMMEETKAYTLLKGIRGEKPSDINSLKETILRVGQLVCDFPEILEMDINPVLVYGAGEGCIALDVKITLSKI